MQPEIVRINASRFKVRSSSNPKVRYTVTRRKNQWACGCRGWIFRRFQKRTGCRHIDLVKEGLR